MSSFIEQEDQDCSFVDCLCRIRRLLGSMLVSIKGHYTLFS